MRTGRMRVLVSAYACGPNVGSEPGVGWNAVREIARDNDVWVITSSEHRDAIMAVAAALPGAPQFTFVDWPRWLQFVKRTRAGYEVQEYFWQVLAYLAARPLHQRVKFDIAHHVTICRYWMPSFLPMLGMPFVWGPVGGGESAPKPFWRGLGFSSALEEAVRECARFIGEHDPMLKLCANRTALGIATTAETCARMRRLGVSHLEVSTQVALSDAEIATLDACPLPPADEVVRFISIARLVAWKGFHLGLRAFAAMQDRTAEYWIVGNGPAAVSLKALAVQLGVGDRVRFLGSVSRPEVVAALGQCGVLVHPSLHDSGGAVCAEAMAAGRPVICLDLGGPAVQVTPETGIKVPAHSPEQAIQGLTEAMDRLTASPELRARLGLAGRARVLEHFRSSGKREQYARWYRDVADPSSPRPVPSGDRVTAVSQ